jgi:iron(III) transport system substrate-binding protein
MLRIITAILVALAPAISAAQTFPSGYPADYARTVAAARKEGRVVVYSTLDTKAAAPVLRDFNALYPDIKVEYNDVNSTELYNRFIAEAASGQGSADVLWSTAMDLQMKLISEGHALTYASPEAPNLPKWAIYRNQAYGTTFEPVGFIYNKRLVPPEEVPQDHAAFIKLIATKAEKYRSKTTSWDIEKSGVGFLFATQDTKYLPQQMELAKGLGATNVRTYASSGNMIEKVSSGEHTLGYNVLASYSLARARKDPSLGVVIPRDYALVFSRVMFIGKSAKNPNAAKVWTDYILSRRGQTALADQAELFSIREDVPGEHTAGAINKQFGNILKPIPVSTEILEFLDPKKRLEFIDAWKSAIQSGK